MPSRSCGRHFLFRGELQMKITIGMLAEMKSAGEKISMLTAYDTPTAHLIDTAGVDTILVGDSVGNAVLGYNDTLPVTVDQMIHHTAAVVRGVERALVIFDMPFMSYQVCVEDALRNAGRAIKETGCNMVKLEGGHRFAETVNAIVSSGIPVCGHLGLTPQSVNLIGYKVQGKQYEKAKEIVDDAQAIQEAGASMLVLECVPWKLAALLTETLRIPTIGIGAGPFCDGQVLVFHDMIGFSFQKAPKFVKTFANANKTINRGVKQYIREVKASEYPGMEHSFAIEDTVINRLKKFAKGGAKK
jgi:3-methyl-2-oxobutanoate hydroxymethyltransferase